MKLRLSWKRRFDSSTLQSFKRLGNASWDMKQKCVTTIGNVIGKKVENIFELKLRIMMIQHKILRQ